MIEGLRATPRLVHFISNIFLMLSYTDFFFFTIVRENETSSMIVYGVIQLMNLSSSRYYKQEPDKSRLFWFLRKIIGYTANSK